eukprot:scaffold2771_cov252-Pinguiococcus_pyrenoidosus.AAC.42
MKIAMETTPARPESADRPAQTCGQWRLGDKFTCAAEPNRSAGTCRSHFLAHWCRIACPKAG